QPTGSTGSSAGGLAHVAVLVLLAAAARAGVVTADALGAVADRLDLLVGLLAVGDRRLLLALDTLAVGRRGPRGGFVSRRADHPQGLLEALLFLHAEDRVG